MFLTLLYYFILVFLIITPQVFSSPVCRDGFSSSRYSKGQSRQRIDNAVTGTESYRQLLVRLAQTSLGVENLSPQQIKALETYHRVVQGEKGRDGAFARVNNYTTSQIGRIIQFLYEVFSPEQVTTLIEEGVVEINRSSNGQITNIQALVEDGIINTNPYSDFKATRARKGSYIFPQVGRAIRRLRETFTFEQTEISEAGVINSFSESKKIERALEHFNEGKKLFIQLYTGTPSKKLVLRVSKILEKTDSGFLAELESVGESGQIIKEKQFLLRSNTGEALSNVNPSNRITILERTSSGFVTGVSGTDRKTFFSFKKATENGLLPRYPTAQDYFELEKRLNAYFSGKPGFTHGLESSFIMGVHNFRLVNPESEAIFLAVESNKRSISSSELNLPLLTNRETQLLEQGYKKSYIGGIDKISEWIIVRERLQELQANPYTTHIEYFAGQIPVHIAHIRRGLENNYFPRMIISNSKLDQLKNLERLEEEAKKAIADKGVTYYWWLRFNNALAEVISGFNTFSISAAQTEVKKSILAFPLKVIMPIIKSPGIITFNRAGLEGIYPAELINRPDLEADGAKFKANDFFIHDIAHANNFIGNKVYSEYSFGHRLFHKRLLQNIENLPYEERKKAETVYFLMTHENHEGSRNISYGDWTSQEIQKAVIRKIRGDVSGIFRFSFNPISKEKKIKNLSDSFMEMYNQTLQHQ